MTKSQDRTIDMAASLRARCPLILVSSREEARVKRAAIEASGKAGYVPHYWDVAAGFTLLNGQPDLSVDPSRVSETGPDAALKIIAERKGSRDVWVMCDMGAWITGPAGAITLRMLKNLAMSLPGQGRDSAQAIVLVAPTADIPPELANHVTVVDWPLPDREEIAALLDATVENLPEDMRVSAVNGSREAAIDAAIGLSGEEAQACFARSLVQLKRIDPTVISAEKKRVIARERLAEWVEPTPGGLNTVGGVDDLKSWLTARATAFSPEARAYGLPAPKGCLLVGVPGCGKSHIAKAIPVTFGNVPLIRLDLGALKSKFVGESEGNLRKTLAMIEALGKAVVWIDEIEKALAGSTGEAGDGGVAADALGTILSWMQERQGQAFIIATANNAEKLPPELLRKGRFDEIFWVDLPTDDERAAIVRTALKANGRENVDVDTSAVADATRTFTGAEIAALIPEAMFTAFSDGKREIVTADVVAAAKTVVPLARTAEDKIAKLREFWTGRARPASRVAAPVTTVTATTSRELDF